MYLALPDSPGRFRRVYLVSPYSRSKTKSPYGFHLQAYHLLWGSFPTTSTNQRIYNSFFIHHTISRRDCVTHEGVLALQPQTVNCLVWAVPFSLAATWGIKYFSFFLRLLRCFTSAGSLRTALMSAGNVGLLHWVFPFGDSRVKGC